MKFTKNILVALLTGIVGLSCSTNSALDNTLQKTTTLSFPYSLKADSLDKLYKHAIASGDTLNVQEIKHLFPANEKIDYLLEDRIYPIGAVKDKDLLIGVLYLNISEYHPEYDYLYFVTYSPDGQAVDQLTLLEKTEFTWSDVTILSPYSLEITYGDDEYSPDPESEARNTTMGLEVNGRIELRPFEIEASSLKFKALTTRILQTDSIMHNGKKISIETFNSSL